LNKQTIIYCTTAWIEWVNDEADDEVSLIITLCVLVEVVTKSLVNTRWTLGDGYWLPLSRGDPRRRDWRASAVLWHITEDLQSEENVASHTDLVTIVTDCNLNT